jgi:hypothetical protein
MGQRGFIGAIIAAVVCVCGAGTHAGEVIFSYSGGSFTNQGGLVAGNSFTAFGGQTLNSLGFVDVGSDGIVDSYQVGLWDTNTQTLLASTTVTPASPLINGFRYAPIPATTIPNGSSFTIGALLHTTQQDSWVINATVIPGAGYGGAGTGRFVGSSNLVFPTTNDGATYVVVNASDAIVPEPATLAGLLLLPAAAILRRRRSR